MINCFFSWSVDPWPCPARISSFLLLSRGKGTQLGHWCSPSIFNYFSVFKWPQRWQENQTQRCTNPPSFCFLLLPVCTLLPRKESQGRCQSSLYALIIQPSLPLLTWRKQKFKGMLTRMYLRKIPKYGCLSFVPYWGPGPQPRHVLTGNWTRDALVCRLALNPVSHTSQGWFFMSFNVKDTVKYK